MQKLPRSPPPLPLSPPFSLAWYLGLKELSEATLGAEGRLLLVVTPLPVCLGFSQRLASPLLMLLRLWFSSRFSHILGSAGGCDPKLTRLKGRS